MLTVQETPLSSHACHCEFSYYGDIWVSAEVAVVFPEEGLITESARNISYYFIFAFSNCCLHKDSHILRERDGFFPLEETGPPEGRETEVPPD